jgi:hypothetical protein
MKTFKQELIYITFDKMTCLSNINLSTFLKKTTAIFFFVGILMSINLWEIEREFPVLPLFAFFKTNAVLVNKIALSILIGSLVSILLFDRKTSLYFLFSSLLCLLLEDQMRWQP